MRSRILISLILAVLAISLVSGELSLNNPEPVYNLGDTLDLKATLSSSYDMTEFLNFKLICGESIKEFYYSPHTLEAGESKEVKIELPLTKSFLGEMRGNCTVSARFDEVLNLSFEISDVIDVEVSSDKLDYNPGEIIKLNGTAIKKNNKDLLGNYVIDVEGAGIEIKKSIRDSRFSDEIKLPEDVKSGSYIIKVIVYEKEGEEITNLGQVNLAVNVNQVLKEIDIATSGQEIIPGENMLINTKMYDQAGDEIEGKINLEVKDSNGEIVLNKVVDTNEDVELEIPPDSLPGTWTVSAGVADSEVNAQKTFYVREYMLADFKIINDTLIIKNIGNVPYKKSVEIDIGGETRVLDVELELEQEKRYRLSAPDGSYDVSVRDDAKEEVASGVALTGKTVGAIDMEKEFSFLGRSQVMWGFLIFIFGLVAIMMFRKIKKEEIVTREMWEKPEKKTDEVPKKKVEKVLEKSEKEGWGLGSRVFRKKKQIEDEKILPAEHSLVMKGNKEEAGILNLKIKNFEEFKNKGGPAMESFKDILRTAYDLKGAVFESEDNFVIIFTPSLTKTFDNILKAVEAAGKIQKKIEEHNKKFRDKIVFGIGINSGNLIAQVAGDKLNFTSLGQTISLSKKISDISNGEILLSKPAHEKTRSSILTEKQEKGGAEVFEVKRIIERERYKEFISEFLERQKEENPEL